MVLEVPIYSEAYRQQLDLWWPPSSLNVRVIPTFHDGVRSLGVSKLLQPEDITLLHTRLRLLTSSKRMACLWSGHR